MKTLGELEEAKEAARKAYYKAWEKYNTTEVNLRQELLSADRAYIAAQVLFNNEYNRERQEKP